MDAWASKGGTPELWQKKGEPPSEKGGARQLPGKVAESLEKIGSGFSGKKGRSYAELKKDSP